MDKKKCGTPAYFRYTWPGKDEAICCTGHGLMLTKIAKTIGLHLQLVPLSQEDLLLDLKCSNIVKE